MSAFDPKRTLKIAALAGSMRASERISWFLPLWHSDQPPLIRADHLAVVSVSIGPHGQLMLLSSNGSVTRSWKRGNEDSRDRNPQGTRRARLGKESRRALDDALAEQIQSMPWFGGVSRDIAPIDAGHLHRSPDQIHGSVLRFAGANLLLATRGVDLTLGTWRPKSALKGGSGLVGYPLRARPLRYLHQPATSAFDPKRTEAPFRLKALTSVLMPRWRRTCCAGLGLSHHLAVQAKAVSSMEIIKLSIGDQDAQDQRTRRPHDVGCYCGFGDGQSCARDNRDRLHHPRYDHVHGPRLRPMISTPRPERPSSAEARL